jgi:hypothetical protein
MGDASAANTNSLRLQAEPSVNEPGLYRAVYVPRLTGGYKATAVTSSVGAEASQDDTGWSTDLAAEKFRSLSQMSRLEAIAKKSGEIIPANKLDEFVRGCRRSTRP